MNSIMNDYGQQIINEDQLNANPLVLFTEWLNLAIEKSVPEPTAMTLATLDLKGTPDARIVLLKEVNENGFVFFTNYESNKGQSIEQIPSVALVFLWKELERQVRVKGIAEKVSLEESEKYFHSRPRESQISSWCSPQSQIISNRDYIEAKWRETNKKFEGVDPLPLPPFWGGFLVVPHQIEFWQGRNSRLHDRIQYIKEKGNWLIRRLAPVLFIYFTFY
ncbi:MAG TPA: pyridoxamine 5'-phosphate oxidase [Saprospiraceae bacterium]|mgnify:CR=1 FL=1|nr:pyridoxamine 5'-phosphate oxidase [Saprospiraceae bacterium]